MSGHSKWSKIKRKKGANDSKRSQMFTKLIKEISVAAKLGGPDPSGNSRLFVAIQNAKGSNMPKDNIERAIKKGAGADAANYLEVNYEGYGPAKVAIFVECLTDNTNRSLANVRNIFNKLGGALATHGTHDFVFEQKGIITFPTPKMDADELTLELIDAGAEDVEIEEGYITVTTPREDFGQVQKKLKDLGIELESANLQRIPRIHKKIEGDDFKKVMRLIDMLEDDEDVQNVYHNMEVSEELMDMYEN